jgi:hypothetical protein
MRTPISFRTAQRAMIAITLFTLLTLGAPLAYGECTVAHTHIGINPTWRPGDWSTPGEGFVDPDPTDNSRLWFFSLPPIHDSATPGWPAWEQANGNTFLVLTPVCEEGERITKSDDPNKTLYTCNFLYSKAGGYGDPNGLEHVNGWHSAFGPQGAWNLESTDANTIPAWDIYLQREGVSSNLDEDDFLMLLPDDTPVLEHNGDTYFLEKEWLDDENAWGIHTHAGFYFWLNDADDEVYVVLSAHDAGGLYQRSANFTVRFAKTVIQPVTGDLNNDGVVDVEDLQILVDHWGQSGIYSGEQVEAHDHNHED